MAAQGSSPLISGMEFALGHLAPADFMDLNAGAGPNSETARLGNTVASTRSIQQRFMNEVQQGGHDERDWIRTWRKKLKETISHFNDQYHDFLIRDKNPETINKMKALISRMSNMPANNRSYFPELGWDISMNTVVTDLETDLELSLPEMKDGLKKILRVYSETLKELFLIDARLQEKIGKASQITDKLQALMAIESTSALSDLAEPMAAYIASVLKNNDISSDFTLFMITYKRWLAMYEIVNLLKVGDAPSVPTCCVCAEADITHAMIPCGHTFCSGCITKQMSLCYICRTSIRDRLKLHFP
jgi:hypothetical protein